jgi:phenylacetate-CoA ligase
VIREVRYYLTRLVFLAIGLRISKWRKHVAYLWSLGKKERERAIENILRTHSPLNSKGVPVSSIVDIYSSPVLTKSRYRELNPVIRGGATFSRKTCGTTGEPTKISLSREELARMLGVRDYCFRHYGIRLGDKEARFWGRAETGIKASLKNFLLNRKVCFPLGENAAESVANILRMKPDYLYGYASLLLEAAKLVEKEQIVFTPPKCVVCTAETITQTQKEYLVRIFNAPVAEEYGATEFDIVAFECRNGHRHLVNPWVLVQGVDGDLLLSDICRSSTNLVNYDIGDSGAIRDSECGLLGGSEYLSVIEGRSIHRFVYVDPNTRFHSVDFSYAIDKYQRSKQDVFSFLITQSEYGAVDLYVNSEPLAGSEALKSYIETEIRARTGQDISINAHVDEKLPKYNNKSYFVQQI